MNNITNEVRDRKPVSAYQQLSSILNALKSEEISLNDALNKIQLKDSKPSRPYCKVTSGGSLALYGISKQPIVLYADQWNKLIKLNKNNYIENYIKYNESKLKFKNPRFNKTDFSKSSQFSDDIISSESVENI
jgi:hypothetical protein